MYFNETEYNPQIKGHGIGSISEGWESKVACNLLKQWPQYECFSPTQLYVWDRKSMAK